MVHGAGNQRGEIARDPRNPLQAACELGREFFTRPYWIIRWTARAVRKSGKSKRRAATLQNITLASVANLLRAIGPPLPLV